MKIKDLFKEDLVFLEKNFSTKREALEFLATSLEERDYAFDKNKVLNLALQREEEFSTGVGGNIAIPHIRDEVMKKSVISFARINPLDWNALDNQPIQYIFFISLNSNDGKEHMEIISQLSSLFLNDLFIKELKEIQNYSDLISLIEKFMNETKEEEIFEGNYDVVAITACPTGIAHTFMAKDMLYKGAKELGINIKVETQGAEGAQNVLTQEEINNAKGVIIACDRVVDLSRFNNHPNVLELGTKSVIKNSTKELSRSLNKEGIQFKANTKAGSSDEDQSFSFDKFGKRAYKSLMTGVSYMLPFVVFGGILIAIAFLIDINNAGSANFGTINPVAKWFKELGGLAFSMMVPILAAYITYAIIGRMGLLPGFIVGLMASGKFLFNLNPETGSIDWLAPTTSANSGVFGAVIGAFLAASIIIVLVKYVLVYLPNSLSGLKNILIIPLLGTLIVGAAFYVINIPIIYLNYGFTKFLSLMQGKPYLAWLLGMVLGAMMAIDLGGPINKAAYVFATASLQGGQATMAMAAVMASGMVPPLAVALNTTFFKKNWTEEERKAGLLNYVMGASFISEGAIPFTAAKPKVMVPANIIGGAITGIIIGIFGVEIAAPHGGILTIALAKSSFAGVQGGLSIGLGISLFILAVVVGSFVEMILITLFDKMFNNKNSKPQNNQIKMSVKKFFPKNKKEKMEIKANNDIHNNFFAFNRLRH